jgi:HK97 family phage portal protein
MFLSAFAFGPSRRADGDFNDRSPFGGFWFSQIGMKSSAGIRVTQASAMRLSAVYGCTKVISESIAVLPFKMYRSRTDGGRDQVTDHWLVRLMRRPNRWQNGFEWREMMQGHLCLRGNAFNEIVDDGYQVQELLPIHPDRIKAEGTDYGYRYAITNPDGSVRRVERQKIWHLRALTNDGVCGVNPIEAAAEVMGVALAGQSYAARFFANDARPGGWIEYDGKFADDTAKLTFRESWQKMQGGANRGKTAVLTKGFKYHELTVNNADAQFLELMKQSRSEIAGIYRVPPHKIGDLERATFANIEQQSMDFVQDCILPWSERWEASAEETFLTDAERDTLEIELDFMTLLRGDMQARTAYYTGNISNGSLTRNEARILEGRNPLDGLDKPLQPVNMQPAGEPAIAPQPANPPQPAPAPSPKPRKKAEADSEDRMQALARAAATRVARKERNLVESAGGDLEKMERAFGRHAIFVAAAMDLPPTVAEHYVAERIAFLRANEHMEMDDFEAVASLDLERLALTGELQRPDPTALALGQVAKAVSATAQAIASMEPANVNLTVEGSRVEAPVQVTVPPAQTHMHIETPVAITANVEPAKPLTRTVVTRRDPLTGDLTAEIKEQ